MILRILPTDGTSLRFAARITIAAMAAYAVAAFINLPEALWAVITALIVVQMSVGGTIGAGLDRLVGTLAGALLGGIAASVHTLWPGLPVWLLLLVVTAPLSLFAVKRPSYRVAPVTAALMLLIVHDMAQPIAVAIDRVIEIAIGCVIGVGVSILVLPYRAEQQLVDRVASGLRVLAKLATAQLGARGPAELATVDALNEQIRRVLSGLETTSTEVQRERRLHLAGRRDPEPLFRTLRRLRSDVAIIDRAMTTITGDDAPAGLVATAEALAAAIALFLDQAADALVGHGAGPGLAALDAAIEAGCGATAPFHLHALDFAMASLRRDCADLQERITERAVQAAAAET